MKKVVIVTYIPFWRQGAGNKTRLRALADFLSRHTQLTVVYGGIEQPGDAAALAALAGQMRIVFLERSRTLNLGEYSHLFQQFLESNPVDCC
ncbi:MAG: hypothetical protein ICV83_23575, partial [Cytophagales bacterium]|nr:hypothetical protein [Cytophagales bacterium]